MARQGSSTRSLREYQKKRDFTATPEPTGKTRAKPGGGKKKLAASKSLSKAKASGSKPAKKKGLLFCVQKHLASHLHYDFRLEHRGVLLSWAVPKGPSLDPADKRLAMRVEDHPLDYGGFEGVIPTGYGAGIVMLWDTGTWEPESDDIDAALEKGDLKFHLNGVKLKGSWVLVRTHGRQSGRVGEDGQSRTWLLIKHRDQWAGPVNVLDVAPDSVKSFGDLADILGKDKPDIWESHKPAEGGEAGAMLRGIIQEATQRKLARESNAKSKNKSGSGRKKTAKAKGFPTTGIRSRTN